MLKNHTWDFYLVPKVLSNLSFLYFFPIVKEILYKQIIDGLYIFIGQIPHVLRFKRMMKMKLGCE